MRSRNVAGVDECDPSGWQQLGDQIGHVATTMSVFRFQFESMQPATIGIKI